MYSNKLKRIKSKILVGISTLAIGLGIGIPCFVILVVVIIICVVKNKKKRIKSSEVENSKLEPINLN